MKHVLVIRLSALGDVAIMAPVLQAVAQANPGVHFTVAAPPLLEPLFGGMHNVDFLGVKKKQNAWRIHHQLKAAGADAVADLHRVNRVGRALALLRLDALLHLHPLRVRRIRKGRLSRWLMLHHWRTTPRKPQWQRYLDVFDRIGLQTPALTPGSTTVPHPSPHACIGLAPFAQHTGKIWPHDHTRRLIRLLAAKGYRVLLFGSKEEAPLLEEWAKDNNTVSSIAGKQSFSEELDTIRSLQLMISMDSANMHFASALGVPVISIWGATHPDFGFYGYGQRREDALCTNLPCQPCSAFGQKPCRHGDQRCLRAITPEQVAEKVDALLAGRG